jgi:hypothetical protein
MLTTHASKGKTFSLFRMSFACPAFFTDFTHSLVHGLVGGALTVDILCSRGRTKVVSRVREPLTISNAGLPDNNHYTCRQQDLRY